MLPRTGCTFARAPVRGRLCPERRSCSHPRVRWPIEGNAPGKWTHQTHVLETPDLLHTPAARACCTTIGSLRSARPPDVMGEEAAESNSAPPARSKSSTLRPKSRSAPPARDGSRHTSNPNPFLKATNAHKGRKRLTDLRLHTKHKPTRPLQVHHGLEHSCKLSSAPASCCHRFTRLVQNAQSSRRWPPLRLSKMRQLPPSLGRVPQQ